MADPYRSFMLRDLERQAVASAGGNADNAAFELCGPPYWSEDAWNAFRATFGRDPFNARELPPDLNSAPEWVFRRMGMRPPLMNGHKPTIR